MTITEAIRTLIQFVDDCEWADNVPVSSWSEVKEAAALLKTNLDEDYRVEVEMHRQYWASGTAEACELLMRALTNGERGCANPAEHKES